MVVFVDDLNMPMKQTYGAQPPIELLRQHQDQGHWFHPKDMTKLYLEDVILVRNVQKLTNCSSSIPALSLIDCYFSLQPWGHQGEAVTISQPGSLATSTC